MTTGRTVLLRRSPQCRSHARSGHARVVGPLVLFVLVQAAAIVVGAVAGLSLVAIVGVVLGIVVLCAIVSRRTVGSLIAGAGLRVAQPYEPGEQVRVFVPALDSVQDAEIIRVGPANTTLLTDSGVVLVPNAQMLRSPSRLP